MMTKRHDVIATAWLLHATSWFLPAIKGFLGSRLDHSISGWEVFLSQTCALRPCGAESADPWYGPVISVVGVVTTVLFVLASPWIVWRASRRLRRTAALVATADSNTERDKPSAARFCMDLLLRPVACAEKFARTMSITTTPSGTVHANVEQVRKAEFTYSGR